MKIASKTILLFGLLAVACGSGHGSHSDNTAVPAPQRLAVSDAPVPTDRPDVLQPIQIASDTTDNQKKPVEIQSIKVDTEIFGALAQTHIQMDLYNPNNMQFAGDLSVPLPTDAWINGYALDIDGKMVSGVPVPKQKARQVFEQEMRKQVDPGLVEHQQGNVFRTRVYPIPADGVRRIRISYLSYLRSAENQLDYYFNSAPTNDVRLLEIAVKIHESNDSPRVVGSWDGRLGFEKRGQSHVAQYLERDSKIEHPIQISFTPTSTRTVVTGMHDSDTPYMMAAMTDVPLPPQTKETRFKNVAVLFDASGSRVEADLEKELSVLLSLLEKKLTPASKVLLYSIRNTTSFIKEFSCANGICDGLSNDIEGIAFDGGTDLRFWKNDALKQQKPDAIFLLSDGLHDFGPLDQPDLKAPVYTICAGAKQDPNYLRFLAGISGGVSLDLTSMSNDAAVRRAQGSKSFVLVSARVIDGKMSDLTPAPGTQVESPFVFGGRLLSDRAKVEVCLGYTARDCSKKTLEFDMAASSHFENTHQLWAQSKLNELLVFKDENKEQISALGKAHGMVTPDTSLMVLETFDQYLQYEIRPPAELEEFRARYDKEIEQQKLAVATAADQKLEQMINMYKSERVNWYNRNFPSRCPAKQKQKVAESDERPRPVSRRRSRSRSRPRRMASPQDDLLGSAAEEKAEPMAEAEPMAAAKKSSAKAKQDKGGDAPPPPPTAQISIKAFDPNSPYVQEIKKAKTDDRINVYYEQRKAHREAPSFYLDCAEYFFKINEKAFALQVLSNVSELNLGKVELIRVLAYRLRSNGFDHLAKWAFTKVKKIRPEDPQSYRDLALIEEQLGNHQTAVDLFTHVVSTQWARFSGIEMTAILELNHCLQAATHAGISNLNVDKRLIMPMELDTRVVFTWDMDSTDMDLWVIEPTKEKAFYSNPRTCIGGYVSRDFTQGFGPEEYLLKRAPKGKYNVKVKYYADHAPALTGAVNMMVDLYSDYGRKNETHETISVYIKTAKDILELGSFKVK